MSNSHQARLPTCNFAKSAFGGVATEYSVWQELQFATDLPPMIRNMTPDASGG